MSKKTNPFWWIGAGVGFLLGFMGLKKAQAATQLQPGAPSPPLFIDDTVKAQRRAREELAFWRGHKETSPEVQDRLREYWTYTLGGKTPEDVFGRDWQTKIPWSAAFISWLVGTTLPGMLKRSRSHWGYTRAAIGRQIGYRAVRPGDYKIQPGDIIVTNRAGKHRTFDDLARFSFSPSHGDLVVRVANGKAETIGGNINHSVRRRVYDLDANGQLVQDEANRLPIAVLRYRSPARVVS